MLPYFPFIPLFMSFEYDHEIPQSHTADQPTAPWGRVTDLLQKQKGAQWLSGSVLFDSSRPINNLSVKQGRVFLG